MILKNLKLFAKKRQHGSQDQLKMITKNKLHQDLKDF